MTFEGIDTQALDQLASAGITFATVLAVGGMAVIDVTMTGRTWQPDLTGERRFILPAWVGPAPSIDCSVADPMLVDLLALDLADPTRWAYRCGGRPVVLGDDVFARASACGESAPLCQTPLSWLQGGARGVCLVTEWERRHRDRRLAAQLEEEARRWSELAA
jgi:hypothetical protein